MICTRCTKAYKLVHFIKVTQACAVPLASTFYHGAASNYADKINYQHGRSLKKENSWQQQLVSNAGTTTKIGKTTVWDVYIKFQQPRYLGDAKFGIFKLVNYNFRVNFAILAIKETCNEMETASSLTSSPQF